MNANHNVTRRDFLKTAGAIVVGFSWSVPGVLAQQASPTRLPGSLDALGECFDLRRRQLLQLVSGVGGHLGRRGGAGATGEEAHA